MQIADQNRNRAVSRGIAVGKLSVWIFAPGPYSSITGQGQTFVLASGDCHNHAAEAYGNRNIRVVEAAVSQLASLVVPPSPDTSVSRQGQTVGSSGRHCFHSAEIG